MEKQKYCNYMQKAEYSEQKMNRYTTDKTESSC